MLPISSNFYPICFGPRFYFHIYELKGAKGKHLYACPMFQKTIVMGESKWLLKKKTKIRKNLG
jgi:hypothetical protein